MMEESEVCDAPTGSPTGMRILLSRAAQEGWILRQRDVKRAFLQSKVRGPNEKDLVVPPVEAEEEDGKMWVVRKSVYGLRSAPRAWYETLVDELAKEGITRLLHDKAMFIWKHEGKVQGIIHAHVDDLLYAGSVSFLEQMRKVVKMRMHYCNRHWP